MTPGNTVSVTYVTTGYILDVVSDVIRCVCNMYHDEGLMITCAVCDTWQHCECVGVTPEESKSGYLCGHCGGPRSEEHTSELQYW